MTSRERVLAAVNHREPDRVAVDLGSTAVTGISASTLSQLRLALGLDGPGDRVKVIEPYQMLGEVTDDLREALGIDTVGLGRRATLFGFENRDWKPWELFDGTPVLVPGAFNTQPNPDGSLYMYPQGDRHAPPSGKMPAGGFYFDSIIRQEPLNERALDPQDNLQEFQPISRRDLASFEVEACRLHEKTDRALVANFGGTGFGDIALVPAPWLKHPKGIRDVEEWYVSTVARRDYVLKVFEGQCEIALGNLARIAEVVGDRVAVVMLTGTDFGTQRGPFISPQAYRELYQPFHKALNDWVHRHTAWKTFIHTCGGVEPLINDFIEAGFDVMNPVQCSAEGMDPRRLKGEYGDRITFWGAGVDTQQTLPFGTPDEVRREVLERLEIFAPGGGFVFNPIHNVQPRTPVQNLLAMFDALREFGGRP
ncbi:MAG: methyltransferase [Armatimonadetes bacterium]|nr:methyltransferase [Armatimonadota bacterium]